MDEVGGTLRQRKVVRVGVLVFAIRHKVSVDRVEQCKAIDLENEEASGESAWRGPWDTLMRRIVVEASADVKGASIDYRYVV